MNLWIYLDVSGEKDCLFSSFIFWESSFFAITLKLIKQEGILCHHSEQNGDFCLLLQS